MKNRHTNTLAALALGIALSLALAACDSVSVETASPAAEAQMEDLKNGAVIPGQYIVVVDEERAGKAPQEAVEDLLHEKRVEPLQRYRSALHGFAAKMSEEQVDELGRDERVKMIEPDRLIVLAPKWCRDDPTLPGCGGGETPSGQTVPWGIERIGGFATGAGSTVWVIDTGVDLDHPDLNVDVARGWSAWTRGRDGSPDDGHGHGTHVAGTIAAIDNDIDVVGVAAGTIVVPVKVLSSSGSGSTSGVIAGVDYVAANASNGDIANMSLGGGISTALDNAVIAAADSGVKFALAAGNDGDDANNHSPARANHDNIYTVAAVGQDKCFASWSNWGNPPVDTAAPGVGILSLKRGGGTTTMSGTSMAAPHVAGILALGNLGSSGLACESRPGSYPLAHR
jgi:subtilisin family serine protease